MSFFVVLLVSRILGFCVQRILYRHIQEVPDIIAPDVYDTRTTYHRASIYSEYILSYLHTRYLVSRKNQDGQ